jgi:hypothetical protein
MINLCVETELIVLMIGGSRVESCPTVETDENTRQITARRMNQPRGHNNLPLSDIV